MEPKIYSVIATYNGERWIEKCLGSLIQSSAPVQVVVVDNCSKDNTISIIKSNFPQVTLIINNKNMGFGYANNQGITKALLSGATHIFLLNQDASIKDNTVYLLMNILQAHPDYGILSPLHYNGDGTDLDYGFQCYISSEYPVDLLSKIKSASNDLKDIYSVFFINAAAWMISRNCIEKTGLFHPVFFHYGEDVNYCNRVLFHGFKIGFTPRAAIFHDRNDKGGLDRTSTLNNIRTVPLNTVLNIGINRLGTAYLKATKKVLEFEMAGIKLISPAVCWKAFLKWIDLLVQYKKMKKIRDETAVPFPLKALFQEGITDREL